MAQIYVTFIPLVVVCLCGIRGDEVTLNTPFLLSAPDELEQTMQKGLYCSLDFGGATSPPRSQKKK